MPHAVRRALAAVALLAGAARAQSPAASPAPAPAAADAFAGAWQGVLRPGPVTLRLTLTVRRDSAGGLAGTFGSPDQTSAQLPATFVARGDTLVVTVATAGITYTGVLASPRDSLRGTFAQGAATLPLAFGRVPAGGTLMAPAAPPAAAGRRPQDPVPPLPYRTEEVAFESAPGVRLAGTLAVPNGAGPFPAVVFVTGSGPENRDEEIFNHRPFLVIADHLARRGVASLRFDDRGVGRSTGDHDRATSADFADDAEAAVRLLRTRPEIARDRVGILGHSEGGLIAPMVAARTGDVAFLVLLAGPGLPGDSILFLQGAALARAAGAPPAAVARQAATQRRLFAAVRGARDSSDALVRYAAAVDTITAALPTESRAVAAAQLAGGRGLLLSPWMRYFLTYDPAPALRRVRVPVLALNGTIDLQVPAAENLAAIRAALDAGGNRDHTETSLGGLNHLFQTARTGLPSEYPALEETVAPAALDAVAGWITARFGPNRPQRAAGRAR